MSDQTSAELEREAEIARARMADTAESIRGKLTPGQLIDEFTHMFSGGDGTRALANLKTQIRDNPLPLALVGAGLAWLAFGQGVSSSDRIVAGMSSSDGRSHDSGSSMRSMAAGVADAASAAADRISSAGDSARAAAGRIAEGSTDYANRLATGSSDYVNRARSSASGLVEREPLVLAAVGLAVGTAIGAMLPVSGFEREELGPQADKLRKDAEDLLERGIESAKEVAAKTYEAASEEADRQGLNPAEGRTMAERVGEDVKTAADTTEDAVRDQFGTDTRDRSTS